MPPEPQRRNFEQAPHYYVYNATCIASIRSAIVAAFNQPRTGLERPSPDSTALPSNKLHWKRDYWDAAVKSMLFLKAQWAGRLPVAYGVPWRQPGFVGACGGRADGGSFAGGGANACLPQSVYGVKGVTVETVDDSGTLLVMHMCTWPRASFASVHGQAHRDQAD